MSMGFDPPTACFAVKTVKSESTTTVQLDVTFPLSLVVL